ncbi:hypothetical protein SAMN05444156_1064 [Verrucomicrobium sp. GAS474]|uniref:hypothetical protein n=1 Tax=Verrucomicrobium sp. GAS474 TaxID=1882831 RepID=UPI000879F2C7|nr:hypothetical protein [Verrucomicrobium sp. GAS474]SDT95848.1 hypothetical protein SAMN05444156_1064 [Verrucomicrobium sp. GAS474]
MSSPSPTDFPYHGPRAPLASLTGSPLWSMPIDAVVAAFVARGWTHRGGERVETPYGLGPEVHAFDVPQADGTLRPFLWIPSYGDIVGEETQSETTLRRVFWILWKAGVKAAVVGGNSGVCEARPDSDPNAIQPGDLVFPWSYRTHQEHRGLPGTPYAAPWPRHNLFLDAPFCPGLAAQLLPLAQAYEAKGTIRKIHTPETVRAALVQVETVTFETDFDILMWRALNKTISDLEPAKPPVATLHGDCVNPLLARFLGIHLLYYHLVCNHAQGLGTGNIHDTLTTLFLDAYPAMVVDLEGELAETLVLPSRPEACRCVSGLIANPPIFVEAMSGSR